MPKSANRMANLWSKGNAFLLQWSCRVRLILEGFDNIPADGRFIVVANHQSVLETLLLRGLFFSYQQSWVLKEELLRIPFFGYALRRTGQIAINRKATKSAFNLLIKQGKKSLEQGKVVFIFPEGTRSKSQELQKLNIGAAALAKAAELPLLPVSHNSGLIWPNKDNSIRSGDLLFYAGQLIYPNNEQSLPEINAIIRTSLEDGLETIKEHSNNLKAK